MALTDADLAPARYQLEQAIENFAVRGFAGSGIDCLREAAQLLEGIRQAALREAPPVALAPALHELEAQIALAAGLIDSAAAFYRGWFGVSPAPVEDYTADGVWATSRSAVVSPLSLDA